MKPTARGIAPTGRPERRPGLVKTTRAKLFHSRTLRLLASSDARWRELFDAADVMSEGAPHGEGSERSYYGSSNIILLIAPEDPGQSVQTLAGAVARDPHVRLRAMRVARREAAQRANAPLDRVRAEITVSPCATGVSVHVEIEALVLPDRRGTTREHASLEHTGAPSAHAGATLALRDEARPVDSDALNHPVATPPTGAPL